MPEQAPDNFSAAFILSLASALIEVVRGAVPFHSSAGNRLSRAAEATEKAVEFIPRDADPFPPMFLADQFLPLVTKRIQRAVVNGGWQRGERDLDRFNVDMLARLADPKNVAKGDYLQMSWTEIKLKLREEYKEAWAELLLLTLGGGDRSAAIRELADLAVVCLIAVAKIETLAEGDVEFGGGLEGDVESDECRGAA